MAIIDLSTPDWDEFFPDTVAVHIETLTSNDMGSDVSEWGPLAGHTTLGAQIIFQGGQVVNLPDRGAVYSTHTINLRGRYEEVKALMRVVEGNRAFTVLSAGCDSQGVKTQLHVVEI